MIDIKKRLHDEIFEYCSVNKIDDVNEFINQCLRAGFTIKKYGDKPQSKQTTELIKNQDESEPKQESINKQGEHINMTKLIINKDDYSIYD